MKYILYYTIHHKNGRILRSLKQFDCLPEVVRFLTNFRGLLDSDWLLVQRFRGLTSSEDKIFGSPLISCYEKELPF